MALGAGYRWRMVLSFGHVAELIAYDTSSPWTFRQLGLGCMPDGQQITGILNVPPSAHAHLVSYWAAPRGWPFAPRAFVEWTADTNRSQGARIFLDGLQRRHCREFWKLSLSRSRRNCRALHRGGNSHPLARDLENFSSSATRG